MTEEEKYEDEELDTDDEQGDQGEGDSQDERDARIKELEDKLKEREEKDKDREQNVSHLRRKATQANRLKEELDGLKSTVEELRQQPAKSELYRFIDENIGAEKDDRDLYEHFYKKFADGETTQEGLANARSDAFAMYNQRKGRSANTPTNDIMRTRITNPFGDTPTKNKMTKPQQELSKAWGHSESEIDRANNFKMI